MNALDFFVEELFSCVILSVILYFLNRVVTEYAHNQVGVYFTIMLFFIVGLFALEGIFTLKIGFWYYAAYVLAQVLLATKGLVSLLDVLVSAILLPLLYLVIQNK